MPITSTLGVYLAGSLVPQELSPAKCCPVPEAPVFALCCSEPRDNSNLAGTARGWVVATAGHWSVLPPWGQDLRFAAQPPNYWAPTPPLTT